MLTVQISRLFFTAFWNFWCITSLSTTYHHWVINAQTGPVFLAHSVVMSSVTSIIKWFLYFCCVSWLQSLCIAFSSSALSSSPAVDIDTSGCTSVSLSHTATGLPRIVFVRVQLLNHTHQKQVCEVRFFGFHCYWYYCCPICCLTFFLESLQVRLGHQRLTVGKDFCHVLLTLNN